MPQQLPLPLGLNAELSFSQFWPGPNREAVEQLQRTAQGRGELLIVLWGGPGQGKTHLLNATCSSGAQHGHAVAYFPMSLLRDHGAEALEGAEAFQIVCLDDVEAIAGNPEWEPSLFRLFNQLRDTGHQLVVSASLPPPQLSFALPDLASRLTWGLTLRLHPLDEDDTRHILQMKSRSLGLEMPGTVARFLMNHTQRDLVALTSLLERLDRASLAAQRRLTIPFVKDVLHIRNEEGHHEVT